MHMPDFLNQFWPYLQDEILVCPLLRGLGSRLLLKRNMPATLNLAPYQHITVSILEQVTLWLQQTQRVL